MGFRRFLGLEYYTSKLDEFLAKFNRSHPNPSASQRKEIEKYRRIHALRDGTNLPPKKDFWENF